MQVNETKSEGLKREFDIAVPSAEIEKNVTSRLKEMARTVQLPGFRPGKAPVSLLRKKYGPAVMGEVLEKTVGDVSQKVLTERNLRPAAQPDIKVVKFEDGSDLEFSMAIEVMPEIETLDMSTIKLERLTAEPEEAEVDAAIERLAASRKGTRAAPASRKSKNGDVIVIDFIGKVDGVEFPGGKADGYSLELGSSSFIPGFEEQLAGVKAGDHVEVKVSFPKEYQAAELAGKDAVFDVDVKELLETVPAKIDDDLAKAFSKENLEALKDSVREGHARNFKEQSRRRLKRSLLDQLSEGHDFEVPEGMLNSESEGIWNQFEEHRKESPESFDDKDAAKSDDEHKAEFLEIAKRRVRLALVLSNVGRLNNIKVGEQDINKAMKTQAESYPGQEQAIMDYFRNSPGAMDGLSASIQEDKVVDFIIEMATVTDKKVSAEELMKDPEDIDFSKGKPKKKSAAPKKAAAPKKTPKKAPKKVEAKKKD